MRQAKGFVNNSLENQMFFKMLTNAHEGWLNKYWNTRCVSVTWAHNACSNWPWWTNAPWMNIYIHQPILKCNKAMTDVSVTLSPQLHSIHSDRRITTLHVCSTLLFIILYNSMNSKCTKKGHKNHTLSHLQHHCFTPQSTHKTTPESILSQPPTHSQARGLSKTKCNKSTTPSQMTSVSPQIRDWVLIHHPTNHTRRWSRQQCPVSLIRDSVHLWKHLTMAAPLTKIWQ